MQPFIGGSNQKRLDGVEGLPCPSPIDGSIHGEANSPIRLQKYVGGHDTK